VGSSDFVLIAPVGDPTAISAAVKTTTAACIIRLVTDSGAEKNNFGRPAKCRRPIFSMGCLEHGNCTRRGTNSTSSSLGMSRAGMYMFVVYRLTRRSFVLCGVSLWRLLLLCRLNAN
jgi:hypothetical protein